VVGASPGGPHPSEAGHGVPCRPPRHEGHDQDQPLTEHRRDTDIERDFGVRFEKAWADPETGDVFCMSEAPSKEPVQPVHTKVGHRADAIYGLAISVE